MLAVLRLVSLDVKSEAGNGTTFIMTLPAGDVCG